MSSEEEDTMSASNDNLRVLPDSQFTTVELRWMRALYAKAERRFDLENQPRLAREVALQILRLALKRH
jgi:hypothetical protein